MTDQATPFAPTPDTSRELRHAFGRYGTGVTIITTLSDQGPLGMTANSFSSVSLDPALVLWSPATGSKRHDAFVKAERFCIHVLGADQIPLAQHFASQGHDFADFEQLEDTDGIPTLAGCLATFHCTTFAVHPAGDHSLILGQVQRAAVSDLDTDGLMFERGRFGVFGASA